MKTRICFYCEREVRKKEAVCYGGDFALRHFCTCADCFQKYEYQMWSLRPPINHFGSWIEISHNVLKTCEDFAIDVESPPDQPMSIKDLLDWIGEVVWEDLGQNAEFPDVPKIDGLGHRAVSLAEFLKARKSDPEQLSFDLPSLPPSASCVLGKFDRRIK